MRLKLPLPAEVRERRLPWAALLERVFGDDLLQCPCGGRRRVVAFIPGPKMAQEILRAAGLSTDLVPASSRAFPTKAQRPLNSVLSTDRARSLGVHMPPWQDSLRAYVLDYLHKAA